MQRGRFLKEGGRDERMARMIGAVPGGVMMVGRGVIIITGPPCQSRSGNLWVSGWVGGRGSPSGAQNLPRTPDRKRERESPHLHEHIYYSADRDMSQ